MVLKVVEFIKKYGTEKLTQKYGIEVKEYEDRLVLNYSQIDSPKTADIVRECRGLILRKSDLSVLCRSFDRFFNYGEGGTTDFDFSKAICFEKLDGTLINLYYDGDIWQFATRKMAYGEGNCGFSDKSFKDIVDTALADNFEFVKNIDYVPRNQTYIFELTSPLNRIVTRYTDYRLTLLAIRNNDTGQEVPQEEVDFVAENLNISRPKVYRFLNHKMTMAAIRELPKLEEGYVCLNEETGERVKVKNPSYLAVAHLRGDGQLSEKRLQLLIMEEGDHEYLDDFPEDLPLFEQYRKRYNRLLFNVIELQAKTRDITDQKEFALAVKDTPISGIMFQLRKGTSFREILNNMSDNAKVKLMGSYG